MKRRNSNDQFLNFNLETKGFKFFYRGKFVPKFILYWRGYEVDDLLLNRSDVDLKEVIE